jgi:hypothetical protein
LYQDKSSQVFKGKIPKRRKTLNKQPDFTLRKGRVSVSAFINIFGDNEKSLMLSLTKSYKEGEEWKTSTSFSVDEARNLQALINEAIAQASEEAPKEEKKTMTLGDLAEYAAGVLLEGKEQTIGNLETKSNGALNGIRIGPMFFLEQNKEKRNNKNELTYYAKLAREGHKVLWIFKTTIIEGEPKEEYYAKYVDGKVSKV